MATRLDGLELGVCLIENERRRITFAGARFDLLVAYRADIETVRGDKSGVGYRHVDMQQRFTNHSFGFQPGSRFYMTTDGMIDQVGGERRRAFGRRRIRDLLAES